MILGFSLGMIFFSVAVVVYILLRVQSQSDRLADRLMARNFDEYRTIDDPVVTQEEPGEEPEEKYIDTRRPIVDVEAEVQAGAAQWL